jgi:hypothetical protein
MRFLYEGMFPVGGSALQSPLHTKCVSLVADEMHVDELDRPTPAREAGATDDLTIVLSYTSFRVDGGATVQTSVRTSHHVDPPTRGHVVVPSTLHM